MKQNSRRTAGSKEVVKTVNTKQKNCAAKAACKDQRKMILYNYVKYKAYADPTHAGPLLTLKLLRILKFRFWKAQL